MKTTKSIIVALFVLLTAQTASAYYCPSTGRWLSRDPLGESGFENLRASGAMPKIGRATSPISLTSNRWINRDPKLERAFVRVMQNQNINLSSENEIPPFNFVGNNALNQVDTFGLDVYKLIVKCPGDALCGCAHHRIIVGDNGNGGSYIIELYGTGGKNCCTKLHGTGTIHYSPKPKLSAKQAIEGQSSGGCTTSDDGSVTTDSNLDGQLNTYAASLDGQSHDYTFIADDCGTFANNFLYYAVGLKLQGE